MDKAITFSAPLGRLLLAILFLLAGFGKIANPASTIEYIASHGLPLPQLGYAIALAAEIGGGLLILVGYKTRLIAALMALFSIATAVFFHADFADQAQMTNFLKNLAIAGGFLQLVANGAGALSIDNRKG
ncbi:MAG: DoxX family protein [Parvibaculum sp.]|uniref:DoxX family protein n=1 Tax=Parvibaculum sp. TaxID=2024848 RepID=UPI0025FD1C7F|nr:DoxX family protein [Parvibaculum sp.]MCE9651073.1 DoxX family protein [Parvibaculum sp.]